MQNDGRNFLEQTWLYLKFDEYIITYNLEKIFDLKISLHLLLNEVFHFIWFHYDAIVDESFYRVSLFIFCLNAFCLQYIY